MNFSEHFYATTSTRFLNSKILIKQNQQNQHDQNEQADLLKQSPWLLHEFKLNDVTILMSLSFYELVETKN